MATKPLYEDLLRFFDNDKATIETILKENAATNRGIDESGMIARDGSAQSTAETDTAVTEVASDKLDIVLEESAVQTLVSALLEDDRFLAMLQPHLQGESAQTELVSLRSTIQSMKGDMQALVTEVNTLRAVQTERHMDAPAKTQARVGFRPSQQERGKNGVPLTGTAKTSEEFEDDVESRAKSVLATIPKG